ncbi:MAG: C39 family peptidase [Oscillospiraceae bacterium]|nr:C39 family peptidase [Oscillospiraceae bacterium]
MRTRRKRYYWQNLTTVAFIALIAVVAVLALLIQVPKQENGDHSDLGIFQPSDSQYPTDSTSSDANELIAAFAKEHDLSLDAWPEKLIELLENNPDTKDFVLNYPLKKDLKPPVDLTEHKNSKSVPLFFQWDERWGYTKYGNEIMGLSGCGPTCLSMVCIFLLNDTKYTPRYIADFAQKNGYCVPGSGSAWTLVSIGGEELGLDVTEIPLDENRIIRNLEVGNPIICVMGPGDFTTTGHFIVMTSYIDGKIKVNDPNSPTRSEMLWDFDDIRGQIRNLWVCR